MRDFIIGVVSTLIVIITNKRLDAFLRRAFYLPSTWQKGEAYFVMICPRPTLSNGTNAIVLPAGSVTINMVVIS